MPKCKVKPKTLSKTRQLDKQIARALEMSRATSQKKY